MKKPPRDGVGVNCGDDRSSASRQIGRLFIGIHRSDRRWPVPILDNSSARAALDAMTVTISGETPFRDRQQPASKRPGLRLVA
jgi:hypothetical protein